MRYLPLVISALTLAACTQASQDAKEVITQATKSAQMTGEKVKELFTYYPPPKNKKLPVPERYCYQVLQDIMCYSHAMPGADSRLVAYQGNVEVPDEPVVEAGVWDDKKYPGQPLETVRGDALNVMSQGTQGTAGGTAVNSDGREALDARDIPSDLPPRMPRTSLPKASAVPLNPLKSIAVGAPPAVSGME